MFRQFTRFTSVAATCVLLLVLPGLTVHAAAQQVKMNYLDAQELDAALAMAAMSPHATLVTIGHSIDYHTDPLHPAIYPIRALRVSATRNNTSTDDNRKNAILFECGMHAREWLATEACWSLALHLVNHAEDPATEVPELLANVDVWIVALTTVAGRVIDDPAHGDPEQYFDALGSRGWRGNGDTRGGCWFGVNVARNFSTGWSGAISQDCTDDPDGTNDDPPANLSGNPNDWIEEYRGFLPFSTLEATALRQFVQNHSVSMAVVVHTNATKVWNMWGAGDVAGTTIRGLAALAWQVYLDDNRFTLAQTQFGGGIGQFSAWLSSPSNTVGEPDNGTARAIQTIFVELPFADGIPDDYSASIYRFAPGDASNGFHPSSNNVRAMIRQNFLFMAEELIRESRSPGCPVLGGCPARDFGLVAAKLGRSSLSAGSILSNAAGCGGQLINGSCASAVRARDYVTAGSYYVDYRVQNFSTTAGNDDVRVTVRVDRTDGLGNALATSSSPQDFSNLALREARAGRAIVDLGVVGATYTITISTSPRAGSLDGFANNDTKVFKVITR